MFKVADLLRVSEWKKGHNLVETIENRRDFHVR